jgi:hypothetical protein
MDAPMVDGLPIDESSPHMDQVLMDQQHWIDRWLTRFKKTLRRHLFTFIAIAIVLALVLRVSQVRNLIFQLPEDPTQRWGFLAMLSIIVAGVLISICGFLWPSIMEFKHRRVPRPIGFVALVLLEWLNELVRRLRWSADGIAGYVVPVCLSLAGAFGLLFFSSDSMSWQPWPLAIGFARMLAMSAFWVGVWLFFGKWLNPCLMTASQETVEQSGRLDDTNKRQREAWLVTGRVLAFLTLTSVLGELLWIAAVWEFPLASLRLYSVWMIFEIASIGILACALIDYLDHKTLWPWRLISVLAVTLAVYLTGPLRVADSKSTIASVDTTTMTGGQRSVDAVTASVKSAKTSERHGWYVDLETRLDKMAEGPAVLVAASGGGSRAALFAAMVLNMLHDEPMQIPLIDPVGQSSTGRPGAAGDASESFERMSIGTWGDHILAISCVSGGTLASARYVQLSGAKRLPEYDSPKNLKYTDFHELVKRSGDVFEVLNFGIQDDSEAQRERESLHEAQRQLTLVDAKYRAHRDDDAASVIPSSDSPMNAADPFVESVFRSKLMDEMCIDYIAPILRGVLVPFESRGQSLYHFWNHQFGWGDYSQQTWRKHWDPKSQPMLLVNATDIDHGRRMVIGFPSLPPELLPAAGILDRIEFVDSNRSIRSTEYSPYSFSSVDPEAINDITLSRAVRISSSFPFGFRPAAVVVPDATEQTPKQVKVLHYLDGGIVDNTGLDTFHALILALAREADSGNNYVATRVMGKLRRRGVVVIEIDSGAKPSRRSSAADPFRIIAQPVGALGSASYTTALRTSDRYLAEIERLLSDDHAAFVARSALRAIASDPMAQRDADSNGTEQAELLSGSLAVLRTVPDEPTCKTDRLTCNSTNLDDQVMTSFALGPQGKARVIAQFLVQRHQWRTALVKMAESYQQAARARRSFNDDARSRELSFTRLIETSGKWVQLLDADLRRILPPPPGEDEVRQRLKIPHALMKAAEKLAEDDGLQNEISRNEDLNRLMEMFSGGSESKLFAQFMPPRSDPAGSRAPDSVGSSFPAADATRTTAAAESYQESLWKNAVEQAKTISRQVSPGEPVRRVSETTKTMDPFESNKLMRQKSGRDFYHGR